MGLDSFNTNKEDDELPPDHCPVCEEKGQTTDHWYNRCTTSNCDVITWITTGYAIHNSLKDEELKF